MTNNKSRAGKLRAGHGTTGASGPASGSGSLPQPVSAPPVATLALAPVAQPSETSTAPDLTGSESASAAQDRSSGNKGKNNSDAFIHNMLLIVLKLASMQPSLLLPCQPLLAPCLTLSILL